MGRGQSKKVQLVLSSKLYFLWKLLKSVIVLCCIAVYIVIVSTRKRVIASVAKQSMVLVSSSKHILPGRLPPDGGSSCGRKWQDNGFWYRLSRLRQSKRLSKKVN